MICGLSMFIFSTPMNFKSNIPLYSLYYAEASTTLRGPSPRLCAGATQLLSKKCCSGGEPLVTQCSIRPVRYLNLRPPAPEANALPLDQLAGSTMSLLRLKINLICKFRDAILELHYNSNFLFHLFKLFSPNF